MEYVYMVQFDWSTTDADGIDIELFYGYDKAFARFKDIISDELNPELSWVGNEAFDENGNLNDDYELDEDYGSLQASDAYWYISDKNNCRHSFIDLIRKEIK